MRVSFLPLGHLSAVILIILLTGTSAVQAQSESPAIADVIFHWETHDRRAPGSDNWPITWSDDNHQYTSWGDGGGFGGTNSVGRVSLGFARLVGDRDSYQGFNVWGGFNHENPATFDGKSYGIISIDGVLYAWWGPGGSTQSYGQTRLLISSNKGATWTQSSWDMTNVDNQLIMPTILNFGKNYAGARDSFVYHYFIRKEPTGSGLGIHKGGSPATGKIDLARVPSNAMMTLSAYEFFTGLDGSGNPTWSADASQRVPAFEDSNGVGWNASVSYNAGLGRYILITQHTANREGRMGMFDAPEPWGPWTTVVYYDSPGFGAGEIEENTFFWNFSNKWLSADGRDFVLVFTGVSSNDSWNSVHGTFVLADDTPPTVPQNLTASAQGEAQIDLAWSASSDAESGVSHYRVYRDGVLVAQAGGPSHADTGLDGSTTYTYNVSAVNGAGLESPLSFGASATTLADTIPPTVDSVSVSSDPTVVTVTFSEPVDSSTATDAGNYAIDNGVVVQAVTMGPAPDTVVLTTSALATGTTYTLTVSGVTDLGSPPNPIAPNTTATFEYFNSIAFEVRVASGVDDVEERSSGSVNVGSSDLELVEDGGNPQTVGIRFTAVNVPQGVTVASAWIQFKVDEATTAPTALLVEGEAADDAAPFGSVSSRPRTSSSVGWNPPPWTNVGGMGPEQRTPDLSAVVQEIVTRPGWSPGNSIVMFVTGSGSRTAESYEGNPAGAPLLHVEYSAPTSPPVPPTNVQVQ